MNKIKLTIISLFLVFSSSVFSQKSARQVYSMDQDWKFHLGDIDGAEESSFNDNNWRILNVPHDWSIELAVEKDEPAGGNGGYLPTGKGWYRKTFTMPSIDSEKQVRIEFDGVHMNSEVWINNKYLGKRPNGYIGFSYILTPFLKKGENTIVVKVDNSLQPNSRWYTGSGIYRHVRLVIYNPLNIKKWGVYATTPEVSKESAIVKVLTSVENINQQNKQGSLLMFLSDSEGNEVARTQAWFEIDGNSDKELVQNIQVEAPELWSLESPHLYSLKTIILDSKEKQVDELTTTIGIREIKYDVDKGFLLNGERIKMNGINIHQDGGPVGVAVPARVWERRLEILKEGGCNAIRTAHNPMAPEFYDLCDQMGFLVMDEVFDEWQIGKVEQGYNKYFDDWYEKDLVDFIRHNRNHPSIVMWSTGNEIQEQFHEGGHEILKNLVDIFHREDPTRPVTLGCDHIAADNGATTPEFLELLDIVGYNYVDRWHERRELYYSIDRHAHPEWKMVGTESGGLGGVRGSYSLGNDPEIVSPDYNLRMIGTEQRWKFTSLYDYVIGDFMWTGIDYYGETRWPSRGAGSGMIDNCGFPKDGYFFFKSHWKKEGEAMIHLFPHWNWEGREGQVIPVLCYSNCDAVELFINGKSFGEKRMEFPRQGNSQDWYRYDNPQIRPTTADFHLSWDVPYEQGVIKAVGKRNGETVVIEEIRTTGKPASIHLFADRTKITNHPEDVVHIIAEILDEHGNIVPTANNLINFEVEGNAKIIGIENGNMRDQNIVKLNKRKAFNGLCLAIISASDPGEIRVKATSKGLKSSGVDIEIEKAKVLPNL